MLRHLTRLLPAVALVLSGAAATPCTAGATDGPEVIRPESGPLRSAPRTVQVLPVADSTWVLSAGTANVLACLTAQGWVLVDTGTRAEALAIRNELARFSLAPIVQVINTHTHDDHAGGNLVYRGMGVPVLSSRRAAAHARDYRARLERGVPRERGRLAAFRDAIPPRIDEAERDRILAFTDFLSRWWAEALEDARRDTQAVVAPTRTFEGTARLEFGGTRFELVEFPGGAHTAGDVGVLVPSRRVAATGDVFARGSAPWADQFMAGGSLEGVRMAQDTLLAVLGRHGAGAADSSWWLVPGHGPAGRVRDLAANRQALADLRACARLAFDAGRKREAMADDCAGVGFPGFAAGYATWQFDEEWRKPAPGPQGGPAGSRSGARANPAPGGSPNSGGFTKL